MIKLPFLVFLAFPDNKCWCKIFPFEAVETELQLHKEVKCTYSYYWGNQNRLDFEIY